MKVLDGLSPVYERLRPCDIGRMCDRQCDYYLNEVFKGTEGQPLTDDELEVCRGAEGRLPPLVCIALVVHLSQG